MKLKEFLESIQELDVDPESEVILEIINENNVEWRYNSKPGDIEMSYSDGKIYFGGYSDLEIVGEGMA